MQHLCALHASFDCAECVSMVVSLACRLRLKQRQLLPRLQG